LCCPGAENFVRQPVRRRLDVNWSGVCTILTDRRSSRCRKDGDERDQTALSARILEHIETVPSGAKSVTGSFGRF
jgi:hypothetical protein